MRPRSAGGTDHIDNLQLLCGHLNSTKGDRGMEYLISQLNGPAIYPQVGHATQTATA